MKLRLLGATIFLLFFLASLIAKDYFDNSVGGDMARVRIGTYEVLAEVVSTPPERAAGLSGREGMGVDEGMLFIFGGESKYSFWMKNMRFPLDIIWIDKNKKIVEIARNVYPESYPEHFIPRYPALFVLEVNAGWTQARGVKEGDLVDF